MRKLFPRHYRPSEDEFKFLWTNGSFVFDTNVLLNLYSYPDAAREAFLAVLNKVRSRSWIPYQVALEFHRNRFNRIKNANEPLLMLRDRIRATSEELERDIAKIEFEKRNTGVDNLQDRLSAVRQANSLLAEALDGACDRLPKIGLDDPIGAIVAEIFLGRVGEPPANQEALDALTQDGSDRYEKKIPPGFKDAKDKKELRYCDRGMTYQAMFGDLILWRQTIAHVRAAELQDVIFITGDGKDDWWQSIDKKILGPSPELVAEFLKESGAKRFWMYPADQFLKYAESYLEVKDVTPETIAQVKETSEHQQQQNDIGPYVADLWSRARKFTTGDIFSNKSSWIVDDTFDGRQINDVMEDQWKNHRAPSSAVEDCVLNWAIKLHRSDRILPVRYLDFAIDTPEGIYGYEVFTPRDLNRQAIRARINKASGLVPLLHCKVSIVVVLDRETEDVSIERYTHDLARMLANSPIASLTIGYVYNGYFMVWKSIKNSDDQMKG